MKGTERNASNGNIHCTLGIVCDEKVRQPNAKYVK